MNIVIANRQRTKKINTQPPAPKENHWRIVCGIENCGSGTRHQSCRREKMALVNRGFLQHEGSTDVITFDHAEKRSGKRKSGIKLHGELFICVDEAILQAKNFKTSWQSEIVRYIVHGVLHLLGHDDLKPAFAAQNETRGKRLVRRLARKFSLAQISRTAKMSAREEIFFCPLARQFFDRAGGDRLPGVITLAVVKWFFGTVSSLTDTAAFFPAADHHARGRWQGQRPDVLVLERCWR
jgi:rRNA maturation RNase YbeY